MTSDLKVKTARENGKKGGRPRKKPPYKLYATRRRITALDALAVSWGFSSWSNFGTHCLHGTAKGICKTKEKI